MNYIKLIRPLNLFIIAATMYLFRVCMVAASPYKLFYFTPVLTNFQFFLLVLISVLTAAGGYVINDIFDVDIDNINKPDKVIINKAISETAAYNLYKVLCAVVVLLVFTLAFSSKLYRLSALPVIIMIILNFYAHTFKRQVFVGNFMISLCTGFTLWLIGFFESVNDGFTLDIDQQFKNGIVIAALIYGLFAFLTTFLREIIKDIEDKEGDELSGCRTIPIVFGVKGAKMVACIVGVLLLSMLIIFVFFFQSMQIKYVSVVIIIGLIIPLMVIMVLIFLAKNKSNYILISNLVKGFMCLGILTMLYFRSGIGPYIFTQFTNFIYKIF